MDILHAWSRAAEMQLWQARLARLILTEEFDPQLLPWIQTLREDFYQLLASQQTPLSAKNNCALVYDPIVEYIAQKLRIETGSGAGDVLHYGLRI